MRILDVLLKTVATVLTSLSLVGCPTQFNVKVLNESSSTIHILSGYSDVELSRIEPGEATQVAYNLDCFRVRAGELIYESMFKMDCLVRHLKLYSQVLRS